ncbi:hypothetical protein BHM03_00016669 [Ensete ventricosum]|nr:hypothetical protein BHM03_00016669 [Ensete ventricosum]
MPATMASPDRCFLSQPLPPSAPLHLLLVRDLPEEEISVSSFFRYPALGWGRSHRSSALLYCRRQHLIQLLAPTAMPILNQAQPSSPDTDPWNLNCGSGRSLLLSSSSSTNETICQCNRLPAAFVGPSSPRSAAPPSPAGHPMVSPTAVQ